MKPFMTFVGYGCAVTLVIGGAIAVGAFLTARAIYWTTAAFPWMMP